MRRLLLDFGGVVIRTPFEVLHRVGSPPWTGPFDPASDPMWRDLQAGRLSEREYWRRRAAELYPEADDPSRELMGAVFAPPPEEVVRLETRRLVSELGGAAVLTNDLAHFHDDDWLAAMGLTDVFHPLIDLSHVGYLKPRPEAFAHALTVMEADPAEVVFVDDQPYNIEGARRHGLEAVWFDVTDPVGSVERVRRAL